MLMSEKSRLLFVHCSVTLETNNLLYSQRINNHSPIHPFLSIFFLSFFFYYNLSCWSQPSPPSPPHYI